MICFFDGVVVLEVPGEVTVKDYSQDSYLILCLDVIVVDFDSRRCFFFSVENADFSFLIINFES